MAAAAAGAGADRKARGAEDADEDVHDGRGNDWSDHVDEMDAADEGKDGVVDLAKGGEKTWARPPVAPFDPKRDAIAFQQLETDYLVGQTPPSMAADRALAPPGTGFVTEQRSAIVRMYGITNNGNSVCCYVHGFMPYFYIPCWPGFTQSNVRDVGDAINTKLGEEGRERNLRRFVMDVRVVKKQSLWGYQFGEMTDFLKITLALPSLVATVRGWLTNGMMIAGQERAFTTYESNLLYVLRFMVDKKIVGGGWLEAKGGTYRVRAAQQKKTYCQIELDIHAGHVIAHEPVGEWMKIAPMRILSFDIECAGRKGHFPTPDIDPVIQIANVVSVYGQPTPIVKNVFTLNTCASIVGSQVISHQKERDMLRAWKEFLLLVDPDVITGYNICNFDLPYLLDRARHLAEDSASEGGANGHKRKFGAGVVTDTFPYLGRVHGSLSTIKDRTFQSKAFGKREDKEIKIDGRIQFDLLQIIRREYKLRSYTLNSVCAHFLGQQKEDVHYSIISDLQNGTAETRRRLAVYCLKDAYLPIQLMEKLMFIVNFCEMARVTGVPITLLLTRGQQVKVLQQLYTKAAQRNVLIPVREKAPSDEKYDGATVLEPKCAFYDVPIATLDFASLYPSIMMAHNLCYTSWLSKEAATTRLQPDQYTHTPNGDYFVRKHIHQGLLPEILQELISARSNAKKLMKTEKDPFAQAVLNGRQLALKISANSVYGFTGATVGQLPCLAISCSVTAFGRQMIERTKAVVEKTYTKQNGHAHDADVVYGDTDSVMVRFGVTTVAEAMALGRKAADLVSKEFVAPIKLEFEKVYFPYLLMNKKRYAGLYWTNEKTHDRMDTKGIETVRRDNSRLVVEVVTTCLDKLLVERDVKGAIKYVQGIVSDLLQNKIDLSMLVISKSLGKSASSSGYAVKQAHVELAERMRKRDPLTAPSVGDRVAYVITKSVKGAKAFEKAEDPIFVMQHSIPIDTEFYLKKQLGGPLARIFGPIFEGKSDGNIDKLFAGDHTLKLKLLTNHAGAMMRFAVKTLTCLGCKTPMKEGQRGPVCHACGGKRAPLYLDHVERVQKHEQLFACVWTQCQRCQGSLHQDVLCSSRDCPIFYRRKKVQKELAEAHTTLERFSTDF